MLLTKETFKQKGRNEAFNCENGFCHKPLLWPWPEWLERFPRPWRQSTACRALKTAFSKAGTYTKSKLSKTAEIASWQQSTHSIVATAHHFEEKCVSTSQAKQRSHVECLLYEDKRECRSDLAVNGVACRRAAALSPMKLQHFLICKNYFVKLLGLDQSTKFSYLTIWCYMVCRIPS